VGFQGFERGQIPHRTVSHPEMQHGMRDTISDATTRLSFSGALVFVLRRVPHLPQPLLGRDQGFKCPSFYPIWEIRYPLGHKLQHTKQLPRDLDVSLITCLMEHSQDFVGQASSVARYWGVMGFIIGRGCHDFGSLTLALPPFSVMNSTAVDSVAVCGPSNV
jgi:hypothetical protein